MIIYFKTLLLIRKIECTCSAFKDFWFSIFTSFLNLCGATFQPTILGAFQQTSRHHEAVYSWPTLSEQNKSYVLKTKDKKYELSYLKDQGNIFELLGFVCCTFITLTRSWISSSDTLEFGFRTINARGTSPSSGSAACTPTTPTSATPGCVRMMSSNSAGAICKALYLMSSLSLSVT